jgi:hypothetical protein
VLNSSRAFLLNSNLGVSEQQIHLALMRTMTVGVQDLPRMSLIDDGERVYVVGTTDEVVDIIGRNPAVFGIPLGPVVNEVLASLQEGGEADADKRSAS